MIMEKLTEWSAKWGNIFLVSGGAVFILITAI